MLQVCQGSHVTLASWQGEEGEVFSYARYIQGVHVTIFLIGTASTLDWYLFHRKCGCHGSYVMFKIFGLL